MEASDRELTVDLRKRFAGLFILNPATPGSVTNLDALELIEDGTADMIAFASLFLANPDLPARRPPEARSIAPTGLPSTAATSTATPTTPALVHNRGQSLSHHD